MSGDDLVVIRPFQRADQDRGQNPVLFNAVTQGKQLSVLPHVIGMAPERAEL